MNKSDKLSDKLEELKAQMIAHDYKIGDSWRNKFFKKKHYKKFDRVMLFHYLNLIQEIRERMKDE